MTDRQTERETVSVMSSLRRVRALQFDVDNSESVFKIEESSGVVPTHGHKTLLVHFRPAVARNYYRCVPCLIHNQVSLSLSVLTAIFQMNLG